MFNTYFHLAFKTGGRICKKGPSGHTLRLSVHTWSLAFIFSTDLCTVISLHTHVFINSAFLPFMNKLCLANFHTSLVAFSRALNQRVWGNFMYTQPQFIHTFKNIWRHHNCLKCFWKEMMTAAFMDRTHVHSWEAGQADETVCPLLLQLLWGQC